MRPSHPTSESSSSPSLRREGRLLFSLLASLLAKAPQPLPARDPYRGVALGVESAWPLPVRAQ